ncbi:Pyruvate/2-oxoacid:ferredoxin oxidoreductase gamma subunit [Priestia megaterium]|uniref:hypothetical protein n=1 Tax=Priestia megaterium TaxID=1404 RepID=UPI003C12F7FB|nr:Pyruvate/2-oxoacid:ferredoxin oxidoreductase gamma subunit [Priestia megaterium]
MFFNKDLVLASIKAVGEDHAIVQYHDKEVEVNLSPEEAKEFHQYVVHQENILVPMNIKTQKPINKATPQEKKLIQDEKKKLLKVDCTFQSAIFSTWHKRTQKGVIYT